MQEFMEQKWLYHHPDWPNFTWEDEHLQEELNAYIKAREELLLLLQTCTEEKIDLREAQTWAISSEMIKTSKIENVYISPISADSSVMKQLYSAQELADKTDYSDEQTLALTQIMMDIITSKTPLDEKQLMTWQQKTLESHNPNNASIGKWRECFVGVGHYIAPPPEQVPEEMKMLFNWINGEGKKFPAVVQAGVAHLWFEIIHPFEDGNGRAGRAIAQYLIVQNDDTDCSKYLSISTQIYANRYKYYSHLAAKNDAASGLDLTGWLSFFIRLATDAVHDGHRIVSTTSGK